MIEDYLPDARSQYKSNPEWRIASLLDQYGLPFIYEKPTAVMDAGKLRIWYPDFTLAYGQVIEYFGVNGDQGYQQRTQHKLQIYQQNQIPVLPLYPKDMGSGWQDRLLTRLDSALERPLHEYRSRVSTGRIMRPRYNTPRYRAH